MKFKGKGYYAYVHSELNSSLADKLQEPLDEEETKEIGKQIIIDMAQEEVLTRQEERDQTIALANSLLLGVWSGGLGYILFSEQRGIAYIAGMLGCAVTLSHYSNTKEKLRREYHEALERYTKAAREQRRESNVLPTPQTLLIIDVYSRICYDLGLKNALVYEMREELEESETEEGVRNAMRGLILGTTPGICGAFFHHSVVGIALGSAYYVMSYAINATTFLTQPYYKRKIDAEIQRVLCEYAPEPRKGA